MKLRKTVLAVVMALGLSGMPVLASAGAVTGGATLPEQITQEITAGESLSKQVEEVATQIRQYANMIQNMETIPQQLLGQIQGVMNQFVQLSSQAQQLAGAGQNIAQQFQQLNAGSVSSSEMNAYEQNYQTIDSNLNNSIDNVLQEANLNPSNFQTVAQAEQAISQDLQNPTSRNNLLQAAASAGQAETAQLGQLVQTANAQANLQAEVQKKKLAAQEEQKQAGNDLNNDLYGTPGQTVTYGNPSLPWFGTN